VITDIYEFFSGYQKISKKSKSLDIFNQAKWHEVFFDKLLKPSEIVRELYSNRFENILKNKSNVNSLRGSIFENLILAIFLANEIKPIYEQCTLQFVPNVRFDFVLFESQMKPIIISLKTSLRERYKQVELEAYYCKQVYKQAECVFISLDSEGVRGAEVKKKSFEVLYIDEFIIATDNQFNALIKKFKNNDYQEPGSFKVVKSGALII
jgi:hypothetical protein